MSAKKRSTKKLTIKESYSDIWSDNAWDAYDIALEYLGAEGLCEALAKAMGTDALADNLKYIFRTNDIPFDEDDEEYDEDEDFDESCDRKSKKRGSKKFVKEGTPPFDPVFGVRDAANHYFRGWQYGDYTNDDIRNALRKMHYSEDFISDVFATIQEMQDDEDRYEAEHDYFDESVKRSVKEAIDLNDGYEQVHSPDSDYYVYRKTLRDDNGNLVKGVWAAQAIDKKTFKPTGEPFEITYDQARGFEPIVGRNWGKIVGKALKMGDMRRESCGTKSNKRNGKKSVTERFHRVDMQDKIRNMERDFGEIKRIVNRNVSGYDDDLYEDFNNAEHALGVLDSKLVEKYDPDRY